MGKILWGGAKSKGMASGDTGTDTHAHAVLCALLLRIGRDVPAFCHPSSSCDLCLGDYSPLGLPAFIIPQHPTYLSMFLWSYLFAFCGSSRKQFLILTQFNANKVNSRFSDHSFAPETDFDRWPWNINGCDAILMWLPSFLGSIRELYTKEET